VITSAASADTYKLGKGIVGGEHRCAVPAAKARLTNLVDPRDAKNKPIVALQPRITIGHDQMTLWSKDISRKEEDVGKTYGADRVIVGAKDVVHTGFWEGKPDDKGAVTTVEIVIDTFGHPTGATGGEHQPEATIRIALTFDGATCIEEWHGNADLVH
jgi:hypothetical protein